MAKTVQIRGNNSEKLYLVFNDQKTTEGVDEDACKEYFDNVEVNEDIRDMIKTSLADYIKNEFDDGIKNYLMNMEKKNNG